MKLKNKIKLFSLAFIGALIIYLKYFNKPVRTTIVFGANDSTEITKRSESTGKFGGGGASGDW